LQCLTGEEWNNYDLDITMPKYGTLIYEWLERNTDHSDYNYDSQYNYAINSTNIIRKYKLEKVIIDMAYLVLKEPKKRGSLNDKRDKLMKNKDLKHMKNYKNCTEYILENADYDFLKMTYDGKNLYLSDKTVDSIRNRSCVVDLKAYRYFQYYYFAKLDRELENYNNRAQLRAEKYKDRGYNITLTMLDKNNKIEPYNKFNVWLVMIKKDDIVDNEEITLDEYKNLFN
jgi:hypothetical protein